MLTGVRPRLAFTSARAEKGTSYADLRAECTKAGALPVMLMLGTGFGLAPPMRDRADLALGCAVSAGLCALENACDVLGNRVRRDQPHLGREPLLRASSACSIAAVVRSVVSTAKDLPCSM